MRKPKSYLDIVLNPFNLFRTKRILNINPTVIPQRTEPDEINLYVYDYDAENIHEERLTNVRDCFSYKHSSRVTWINVDGLRRADVEIICNHYGIHQLVQEDILSIGQRPKVDEIEGVMFCLLNMLYFNEKESSV